MDESMASEQGSVPDVVTDLPDALQCMESMAADATLCAHVHEVGSLSADALLAEPARLRSELQRVRRDTEATVFANYSTFIGAADCSKQISAHFSEVSTHMEALCGDLGTAGDQCAQFQSGVAGHVAEQSKRLHNAAGKHQQLLDVLEMPQLMETCVRAGYWEEALSLCAHAARLKRRLAHIALVVDVAAQVDALRAMLLANLLNQFNGSQVTLPQVLKVVPFLRRLHVFEEHELRIRFLMARERYLAPILSSIPTEDAFQHCSKYMELARVHLFDIATQYKAAFASEMQDLSHYDVTGMADRGFGVSGQKLAPVNLQMIFNQWLTAKVEEVLSVISTDACRAAALGPSGRLDSLLTQAMYFGASFGRLGADFRPSLVRIFTKAVADDMEKRLHRAEEKVCECPEVNSGHGMDLMLPQAGGGARALLCWPTLAAYTNAVAAAFNAHRNFLPLNCAVGVAGKLNAGLGSVAEAVLLVARNRPPTATEAQVRTCCELLASSLPTSLNAMLDNAFPEKAIRTQLGLSATGGWDGAADNAVLKCRIDSDKIRSMLCDYLPDVPVEQEDTGDVSGDNVCSDDHGESGTVEQIQ